MSVDWVMVPVPEELEAEASAYLMRLRMKDLLPLWDQESADAHLAALDDDQRRGLTFIARAVVNAGPTTLDALAAHMGMTRREATGLVREMNQTRVGPSRGDIVYLTPRPAEELQVFLPIAELFAPPAGDAPDLGSDG
jgi:hypothetical protein